MSSNGSQRITDLESASVLNDADQFLFFQNSTKTTKRITKGDMASTGGGLRGVFINAATNENVWNVADFARTTANSANISSSGAQASANGRNKIFYQADSPVSSQFQGYIIGTTLYADAVSNTGGVPIRVGSILTAPGNAISAGTVVTAFGSGSGGLGTYTINNSQNVGSVGSKITITANPQFLEGDIWYETDNNYRTYRRSSSGTWVSAFGPILTLDGSNKVSGFVRVSDVNSGSTATDEFAVIADKFQIWNGSSDEAPFTVDASSPTSTFTGTITGSVLTLTSNATNTLKLGMSLAGSGVTAGSVIRLLLSGTIGQVGSTYLLSQVSSVSTQVPMQASYAGQVRIVDALIQTLDAGKITSGFLSSKVIELPDSKSYIQSFNFVETWVTGKRYVKDGERIEPSDQSMVKVLQGDGTYTVYKALVTHTSGATFAGDLSDGKWTVSASQTLQGFRIVGNGQADFQDCTVIGTIRSSAGYFGTTQNAVQINSSGLLLGTAGQIKSAGISYNNAFSGNGFFLGNVNNAYQFYVGDGSKYVLWDGVNLKVSGNIVSGTTIGTAGDAGHGLTIYSSYGLRKGRPGTNDDTGVLTLTGGEGNGIYFGGQIDLVGSVYTFDGNLSGGTDGSGQIAISAGYRGGAAGFETPLDGAIVFRTSREYNTASNGNDNHSGIQRMRIELDGTVRVVYLPSNQVSYPQTQGNGLYLAPNGNPGRFIVEGDAGDKHIQLKNGVISFSSAVDTYDVNLYRSGANALKTDDDFIAASVTTTSTKKAKKNIKKYNDGLGIINKLKPVSFNRKINDKNDIGLIAEEVDKIIPVIVRHNENNEAEGLDYSKLTVVLINAVKELSAEVRRLEKKIKDANSN